MPYNEKVAEKFREALSGLDGISEKKMFGGLCFLLHGNMLCGVHKDGGMARVGKDNEVTALQLDGIAPLSFTGRKMGGMVDIQNRAIETQGTFEAILSLAIEFVGSLPAK